jgi:hypothetical protein
MMEPTVLLELIALCFLFLLSSIWSEENARFGYILVPLMAAFFWWAGFLPFAYLTTVIPLMVFMGIIAFMRSQLKYKWGVFGTSGGILYKLVFYLIMIQMAIGYINGIGLFGNNFAATPVNEYTTYNLSTANSTFGQSSYGITAIDMVSNGLQFVWTMFKILWSMIASVFVIYPTLVNTFGIPENLSLVIQCGIYVLYALELINMVYKPYKVAEV